MRFAIRILILPVLLLAFAGCGTREPYAPIRDVTELAQDAGAYHGLPAHERLLPETVQQAAFKRFMAAHFDPWMRTKPKHSAEEVFWGLKTFAGKKLFGENTLPRAPDWLDQMRMASRIEAYPDLHRRAVAVTNASMRVLPTHRPAFYEFDKAGEGFPFDYLQNSLVLAGTPLLATHATADGAWILVESRFAYGWVRATDIAWVDDAFAAAYRTGTYVTVTQDHIPVIDRKGQYCFTTYVGALFPVLKTNKNDTPLLGVPVRDHCGNAVLHLAELPDTVAEPAPIPATPANFSRIANTMLGLPYGWGGLFEDRDCSATTMDLMAAFGILLPRNSSKQILTGSQISLKGLSRKGKKRTIVEKGTPFLTLVRKLGHIMLYVGSHNGNPIVLHATWGVKTKTTSGYGRKIIGSTVITTLEPGLELHNLARPGGVLLDSVYAITTLP